MAPFVSIPADPPMPNQASYVATYLDTVREYTYESYLAAFGVAPPYDLSRALKSWGDSTQDPNDHDDYVIYYTWKQVALSPGKTEMQYKQLPMPCAVAATVNILPPANMPIPGGIPANSPIKTLKPIAVPMRDLDPSVEHWRISIMGFWEVYRSDLTPPPTPSGTDIENAILALVTRIASKVGA